MDSRHLRAFVAVADHGGISAAASRLGYAQSSISDQIKGLEREVGATVFNRASTGAVLTDAGQRLLPYARQMLELDQEMRRSVAGLRPALRIGALETLAAQWLPEVLAAFERGAGGPGTAADVTLTVASRSRLAEDLAAGRLDATFVFAKETDQHVGPRAVVAHDRAVLVAAPDHQLTKLNPLTAEALRDAEFLIAERGCTSELLYDQYGRDLSHNNKVAMVTGSLAALLRLTALGRGIAVLPHISALRDLAAGDVVMLDLPYDGLATVSIEARWRSGLGAAERSLQGLLRIAHRNQPPAPAQVTSAQSRPNTLAA